MKKILDMLAIIIISLVLLCGLGLVIYAVIDMPFLLIWMVSGGVITWSLNRIKKI